MSEKRILLTVFCGTSAELLLKGVEFDSQYKVLYLPNDKKKDSELLIEALEQEHFDYIMSFGQRPNIKDKVHMETRAKKGEASIVTSFDCIGLKHSLEQTGLQVKLSDNAGNSFCNELYWNGLCFLAENEWKTQMVFLHVPFEKHISDMKGFRSRVFEGIRKGLLGFK